jgi:hypothetical protein
MYYCIVLTFNDMDLFWIYDTPIYISFTLIVGSITLFSISGVFVFRPFVTKWWSGHDNNDQIAFYLSAIGVFYGITLGLLAAGTWQNYEDSDDKVTTEASAIAALYRDVRTFPAPINDTLKRELKAYTYNIFHDSWALHQQGVVLTNGTYLLDDLQETLYAFEPKSQREMGLYQEALRQFNRVVELRRDRLSSVSSGMPMIIWSMILFGAAIALMVCWLFNIPSIRLHIYLNATIGLAIGGLVFLILMLDYPFRGILSITPDSYIQVYEQLMK